MEPNNNKQFGPTDKTDFSMDNSPNNHGYRMILITGIVALIAIGGFFILRNENLQQVIKNTVPSTTTPSEDVTTSSYVAPPVSTIASRDNPWVEISADTTSISQNKPFTFTVRASSAGKDITGYDILLAIDPNEFQIQSITSEVASFSILQFEKGTHVTVTGIKALGQNDPSIFNDTAILKVTVNPMKRGASTLSVLLTQGNEKTMLVDTEVIPITPQVGSLQVEVK